MPAENHPYRDDALPSPRDDYSIEAGDVARICDGPFAGLLVVVRYPHRLAPGVMARFLEPRKAEQRAPWWLWFRGYDREGPYHLVPSDLLVLEEAGPRYRW